MLGKRAGSGELLGRKSSRENPEDETGEKWSTCLRDVLCQHPVSSARPIRTTAKWLGELSLSHSTDSVSGRTAHSVTCTVTQAVNRAGAHSSETCMSADTTRILEEREASIYLSTQFNLHQPPSFFVVLPRGRCQLAI